MFGYVRPALNAMGEDQKALYQSAYCGLCHTLGDRYGLPARFTLQYDFTFLAILLSAGEEGEEALCRRCPAHPVRAPRQCLSGPPLELAADESVILTYHKLDDDVSDRDPLGGLPARLGRGLFRGAYRRAAERRPEFDGAVREGLARLRQFERDRSPALDRVADAFAALLAHAATVCPPDSRKRRTLEQLLYHLGRWVYLMDAWDDLEEDARRGRYNPLDARFAGRAGEERDYVDTTATHSLRLAAASANLMDLGEWAPIVENVLYVGLPAVQSAVLEGRWREIRRKRRQRNEGPL